MPGKGLTFYFGPFVLDAEKHLLLHKAREIELRPKAYDVLLYLVRHRSRLVAREELLEALWSGTVVSETTLSHCIEEIRAVLDDDAHNPLYVKTVHRLGYKFIATVTSAQPKIIERQGQTGKGLLHGARRRWLTMLALGSLAFFLAAASLYLLSPPKVDSIAVLPFLSLGADSDHDYMADGLTEAVIARLATIKGVRVISRTSVMQYKTTRKPLPVIARELDVDAVIEGSLDHENDRIRVTAQLIRTHRETHLWAHTYERPVSDLWSLHDELAEAIARAVSERLSLQPGVKGERTVAPQAYEACLKGRWLLEKRREESFLKAIDFFKLAIQEQPGYAAPYAGLASAYNMLANYDLRPPALVSPLAKAAALQALRLDENLSEAHAALGFTHLFYDWDRPAAETALKKAIKANPSNSQAHHWLALLYASSGRFSTAQQQMQMAKRLDPLSLIINTNEGWLYYYQRQYQAARAQLEETLEMDPEFASALIKKAWVLQQTREEAEAAAILERVHEILQGDLNARAWLAHGLAAAGETARVRLILAELNAPGVNKLVSPYLIACIHAALGEHESAWDRLDAACLQRSGWLVWLGVDPKLDALRPDPRFVQLLEKIGLSQEPPE